MVKVETKWFGVIEIEDEKVITFEKGIIGFEDFKKYTLIFDGDNDNGEDAAIIWLQSLDEPALALPIMKPGIVMPEYDPIVEDELVYSLGDDVKEAEFMVFVTLTVPQDITKMTCNLKAPIIINADTMKAVQLIADNEDYSISHPIYDYLKEKSEKSGKDGE